MFVGSANVFLFSSSKNKKPETFLVRSELCNFSNRSDSSDVEPCSERVSGMSSDGRLTAGSISSSNSRLVFGQSVTGAVKMMEVTQATAAQARWLRPSAKGWAEAGPVAASSAQAFSLSSSWHVWAAAGLASKGCVLFLGLFSEQLPQCQQCGHQAEFRSHENSTFGNHNVIVGLRTRWCEHERAARCLCEVAATVSVQGSMQGGWSWTPSDPNADEPHFQWSGMPGVPSASTVACGRGCHCEETTDCEGAWGCNDCAATVRAGGLQGSRAAESFGTAATVRTCEGTLGPRPHCCQECASC